MSQNPRADTARSVAKIAFRFVLILGIVKFFADMTYKGARAITGPSPRDRTTS
jgi:hypothetical protein